mgnify:CR=1 FL=1
MKGPYERGSEILQIFSHPVWLKMLDGLRAGEAYV